MSHAPQRFAILHSNDIHGRIEGLARIATLVSQVRAAQQDLLALYFDLGDIEESANQLSNLTKGVAMHRLLSAAGCDAAVVGNGALLRYGQQVLAEQAAVATYPLLLANLTEGDGTPLPGVRPTAMLTLGSLRLGLIGITSDVNHMYQQGFGLRELPVAPLVRDLAAKLRSDGADVVVLLSHMGLDEDRKLAEELQGVVPVILGAHSHHLLPKGERIGSVLIAQAGQYAEHLGQLDCLWDGERLVIERVSVHEVSSEIELSPAVMGFIAGVEDEIAHHLDEIVGELAMALTFSDDEECGVANLAADMLRERMRAEVAICAAGQAFTGPLPAGALKRGTLWNACPSPANPGVATLTGEQLLALVARGLDPAFAAETPRSLRGAKRGLLHLSGAAVRDGQLLINGDPVIRAREYRVAGTDWELDTYGGYADPAWNLQVSYDMPIIVREALEEYLIAHRPVTVTMGRLQGLIKARE